MIYSPQNIGTNRANNLLEIFLESRFPKLFSNESRSVFWDWLSTSGEHQKSNIYSYIMCFLFNISLTIVQYTRIFLIILILSSLFSI